jgi:hypothetical protein
VHLDLDFSEAIKRAARKGLGVADRSHQRTDFVATLTRCCAKNQAHTADCVA